MEMIPAWIEGGLHPVEKLEVHRRGLRHRAVSVFLLCGGDLLIQRRAMGKYHTPGLWANTCCTHPAWKEEPRHCARRRLNEELGLAGLSPVLRDQVEYRADVGNGMTEHEVVDLFLVHAPERPALHPNPAEVMDTRWIGLHALKAEVARDPASFTPWMRIYLDDYAERIFGPDLA